MDTRNRAPAESGRARARRAARPWLAVVAVITLVALAIGISSTRQRIADNESAQLLKILAPLLPEESFDNRPDLDRILLEAPELLGDRKARPVYRARRDGELTGVVISTVARDGYLGPIELLVSLDAAGTVLKVHVLSHEETPALGGQIERRNSDWLEQFSGRGPGNPPPERWTLRQDGGDFDQITGATITSRAVVKAVARATELFRSRHDDIISENRSP